MRLSDPFSAEQSAYEHNGDRVLLESLGLRVTGFRRDWTDLGTVTLREAEPDGEFGPRPATTIKVEVEAFPAMIWRFTITRPRDETEEIPDDAPPVPYEQARADGTNRWRAIYEPVEVFEMRTGSGGFSTYWPTAKQIAEHMVDVVCVASRESHRPEEGTDG